MTRTPANKDRTGELVDLWWDGPVQRFYVRGHLPTEEFEEVLAAHLGELYGQDSDEDRADFGPPRHAWARWDFAPAHLRGDGVERIIRTCDAPGRGRFPVTVIERIKHHDR